MTEYGFSSSMSGSCLHEVKTTAIVVNNNNVFFISRFVFSTAKVVLVLLRSKACYTEADKTLAEVCIIGSEEFYNISSLVFTFSVNYRLLIVFFILIFASDMKRVCSNIWMLLELWLMAMAVFYLFDYLLNITPEENDMPLFNLEMFAFDSLNMLVLLSFSLSFNHLFIRIFQPLQNYKGKMFLYSVLLLVTNLTAAILLVHVLAWLWGPLPRHEYVSMVYLFCLVSTFISSIHANISFRQAYRLQVEETHRLEMDNARQQELNLQTSLMALKTQIDPHFLFNNFSILSELIEENPKEASVFLDSLNKVYRYKLVNMNNDLVSLEDELKMISSYESLIQSRFGSSIQVVMPAREELTAFSLCKIPPLAIQLLVENAIKHNAHSLAYPLIIDVTVKPNGYVVVSNPIIPLSSKVESTGLGLSNLKSRYQLLSDKQPEVIQDKDMFTVVLPLIKA